MRPPPPPTDVRKYPVTAAVGVLAVAVTLAWHNGKDVSPLFMSYRAWDGELWRLVTSAFPHVGLLHLLFNLYWLWVFGTLVEGAFGHLPALAIFTLFAAGSAAAEYALFQGGVGLSGVGYGLFGLLWALSRNDERFRDAIDNRTVSLFVGWFFLCIALTASGALAVANVAHAAGAAQGVLLGLALSAARGRRLAAGGLVGLTLAVLVAATAGRPLVNLSAHPGEELAAEGYLDLQAGRDESAAALLGQAVQLEGRQSAWWYNLAIAHQRLGREGEATEALRRATQFDPGCELYRKALADRLAWQAARKQAAGEDEAAAGLYRESLALDGRNAAGWFNLGAVYAKLGRREDASRAYNKAVALAPDDAEFRAALQGLHD